MSISKGVFLIFFFKIVGASIMFYFNVLLSNKYGSLYLGTFNLLFSILQLGSLIACFGIDFYILKILPSINNPNSIMGFLQKIFFRLIFTSFFVSIILISFSSIIDNYIFKNINASRYIIWIAFLLIPYTLISIIPEILRSHEKYIEYAFLKNILFQFVLLSASFLFINKIDIIFILYYSILISFIISILFLLFHFKQKKISFLYIKKYSTPILRNSYNFFLTSAIIYFNGNIDQFMIGIFLDERSVGFYSVCLKISLIISFILISVTTYISPKLSRAYAEEKIDVFINIYKKSSNIIIIFSLPLILILCIYPNFFLGLFGEEFKKLNITLYFVLFMNLTNVFFGPLLFISNLMGSHVYVRNILSISFILNIFLNVILIPKYGISGAAIATSLSTIFWKYFLFQNLKIKLKQFNVSF